MAKGDNACVEAKMANVQNKIIRLFSYLEKALVLDDSVVRDFRTTTTAPSPWWLADLPDDVENLYIKNFERNLSIKNKKSEIKEKNYPYLHSVGDLFAFGKKRGFVTEDEILHLVPSLKSSKDIIKLENIYKKLLSADIEVRELNNNENYEDGCNLGKMENSDFSKEYAWLRVEKKNIKPAPELPKNIIEWIDELTPIEVPKPKEKIDRKVKFDQDANRVKEFKKFRKEYKEEMQPPQSLCDWIVLTPGNLPEKIEEKYSEDRWLSHPELINLLEDYVENDWRPWAEKVNKIYKANIFYDQLYALRLLLKNEGDNYELLLGHGLLTWKNDKVGNVYTPIFLTPLVLDFDASKRVIEIFPDPMFRGFVEISALYDMDNPGEMDFITWSDKINAEPFDFWHIESLKIQSQTLINYISTESNDCFDDKIISAPEISNVPSIWNAPVIFARKRTNDLWSKYASNIRKDIEQNNIKPTEFITDLVGEYDEKQESTGEEEKEVSISESELFFPLPWNDEQKRIAERLESNYGVVVKGPPGTGKSHTIANLISRFLAQGKTVLVTSQTSKALEVLRDKLPENIRSLAVSQLNQTAKRDDVLQQSISEISSNLGERHTKFSEQKAESIRKELKQVREEKASLANQIRKYILTDSSEKINIDGEEVKPVDAARIVNKYKNSKNLDWFTDNIYFDKELDFNEDDLRELHELLSNLTPIERELNEYDLPDHADMPDVEIILGAFLSFRELGLKARVSNQVFNGAFPNINQEDIYELRDQLLVAKKVLNSINEDYEDEIFRACAISKNEREKLCVALSKINEKMQIISNCSNEILGHEIGGESFLPLNDIIEAISILKEKVAGNLKIGTFGKLLLPSNAKKVLENCTVDGRSPNCYELLNIFSEKITMMQAERDTFILLRQIFSHLKSIPKFEESYVDIVQLEVLIDGLKRIINYSVDFGIIDNFCKKTNQFSDFIFTKKEDIDRIIEILESHLAKFEIADLDTQFSRWVGQIENSVEKEKIHPIVNKLIESINKKNTAGWKNSLVELDILRNKREKAKRLCHVSHKIKQSAPNLFADIVGLANDNDEFSCPQNLSLTWRVARLDSWLHFIHDHVNVDDLQNKLERLTKNEFILNSELVTILAWQRQIDKVTKKQRDALMAWSHEMKKYGKGTGKYAITHLRAAQEALKEAKNAVPVWIMPLTRVAQMFSEPKAGMFDVVIFDEASQCDIRGINIGYLGKKLLVVGDPEQISPAGIFQNQEKIFELISRFLSDIPFKDSFSITSSLFDLAKIRLSNIIQLNEHFRCVPEIIAFSNYHIYEGKLKSLRYPHPKGLLSPALVPVFIENGYQNTNNKVNEPEAEAIVAKLVECLNDPNYQKRPDGRMCTFGIISLLANDQAKHIEKLIRNLVAKGDISEKIIEERRIECGDAYKFQGDERDVMFLSMVRALDPNNVKDTIAPLVDEGAKRRFNVAASRSRDQMFLFHSIPLDFLGNKNDWRYKLLSWFYDPKKEELNAGREALKREFDLGRASQFSFDVGNILIDRGYRVIPEYPVIGYRIDLVIQGLEARLAVECDGDQYHTLDNWEEDQIRERQLRRAGWEFWRVTGSAFYRYKEDALASLWNKLDELGIKPIIHK